MKQIIDEIGGWPLIRGIDTVSINWFDLILKTIRRNIFIDFPFKISTIPNINNESHADIAMLHPVHLRISSEHYLNFTQSSANRSSEFEKYAHKLIELAVLYGADRDHASNEVAAVLEFETALANVSLFNTSLNCYC